MFQSLLDSVWECCCGSCCCCCCGSCRGWRRCGRVSCGCCRGWRWRRRAAARSTIYAHGEVRALVLIGGGRKVSNKEVAIEESVLVVATWRAHAVGAAGGRVKGTAREVADRRDIEPVVAFRQTNVQSDNFDHVFANTLKIARSVTVTTGVMVMPLAINVPPLPSDTPCRISQVAPVTWVFSSRLSEKTDVTTNRTSLKVGWLLLTVQAADLCPTQDLHSRQR